jgi:hypothetical protein
MYEKTARRLARICLAAVAVGALASVPARSDQPSPDVPQYSEAPGPDPIKARGVVEVRTLGAVGDGNADDTEALQRAIDAGERSNGVVMLDPPASGFAGRYLVTHSLVVSKPVTILGLGRSTQIVVKRLDFDVFQITGPAVEIGHFRIFGGPQASGAGGTAFHVMRAQNVIINQIAIAGLWSGVLDESSGNLKVHEVGFVAADRQPDPGHPRFGFKATATLPGNANLMECWSCGVTNYGTYTRTVDGFVLANGFNSLNVIKSGVLNGNRAFLMTADGGKPPNFLVLTNATSDHSNVGIELDEGAVTNISSSLVTSSPQASIRIAPGFAGPVNMANNQVIATAEGIDIAGGRNVTVTGGTISNIVRGDGIRIGSSGTVTIQGVNIIGLRSGSGIHILADHADGWVTVSGITERQGAYGLLVDPGTPGGYTVTGNGFGANRLGDVRDGGRHAKRVLSQNSTF